MKPEKTSTVVVTIPRNEKALWVKAADGQKIEVFIRDTINKSDAVSIIKANQWKTGRYQ